jgi:hypothetical protein
MSPSLISTTRKAGQMRGVLARVALAASQIAAAYERYGPDQRGGSPDPRAGSAAPGSATRGGAVRAAVGSEHHILTNDWRPQ